MRNGSLKWGLHSHKVYPLTWILIGQNLNLNQLSLPNLGAIFETSSSLTWKRNNVTSGGRNLKLMKVDDNLLISSLPLVPFFLIFSYDSILFIFLRRILGKGGLDTCMEGIQRHSNSHFWSLSPKFEFSSCHLSFQH